MLRASWSGPRNPAAGDAATYTYDGAGNRTGVCESAAAESVEVVVDEGDRLLAQGATRLAYDACGRTVWRGAAGRDGGGNQILLRLGPPDPPVWLHVHDAEGREWQVADTFTAFLAGLHENPDFI